MGVIGYERTLVYRESLGAGSLGLAGRCRRDLRSRRSPRHAECPPEKHSYTYTVYMKNITLSVDENVLAAVRRHAAERDSTVNALVRDYLTKLAAHDNRADRARARLRQLSGQSTGRLGKKTWSREDLHDR